MGLRVSFFLLVLTLVFLATTVANAMYNVESYGAKPDGRTDSSAAFLKAWDAVCGLNRPATIFVPRGKFLLRNVIFHGETCRNRNGITLQISGTLLAPSDYNVIGHSDTWIKFNSVNGVSIIGGTLDAQGAALWNCKKSGKGGCPQGSTVCMHDIYIYISYSMSIDMHDACMNEKIKIVHFCRHWLSTTPTMWL